MTSNWQLTNALLYCSLKIVDLTFLLFLKVHWSGSVFRIRIQKVIEYPDLKHTFLLQPGVQGVGEGGSQRGQRLPAPGRGLCQTGPPHWWAEIEERFIQQRRQRLRRTLPSLLCESFFYGCQLKIQSQETVHTRIHSIYKNRFLALQAALFDLKNFFTSKRAFCLMVNFYLWKIKNIKGTGDFN